MTKRVPKWLEQDSNHTHSDREQGNGVPFRSYYFPPELEKKIFVLFFRKERTPSFACSHLSFCRRQKIRIYSLNISTHFSFFFTLNKQELLLLSEALKLKMRSGRIFFSNRIPVIFFFSSVRDINAVVVSCKVCSRCRFSSRNDY